LPNNPSASARTDSGEQPSALLLIVTWAFCPAPIEQRPQQGAQPLHQQREAMEL
jgi:hypothetical protein